jgi:hypothetical protein
MCSRLKKKRETKAKEKCKGKNRSLNGKHSSLRDPFSEQDGITGRLRGSFHYKQERHKNVKLSL